MGAALLVLPLISGCFDFDGKLRAQRGQLELDLKNLQQLERKVEGKFGERDWLRSMINRRQTEIGNLEQYIKQGPGATP